MKYLFTRSLPICMVVASVLFCSHESYASVNIPLGSPFYQHLAMLDAQGLIKSGLLSTKPVTRSEAGRLLAEAADYAATEDLSPFISQTLDRAAHVYAEEIAEARLPGYGPRTYLKPLEELSLTYTFLDGPFSVFNNEGIEYFDGNNAVFEFQSSARLSGVFSVFLQPIVIYNGKFSGIEGYDKTETTLHKYYVKLTLGNFELEAGRDSLWWGPGYHGALIISSNARPFNLIKISNPRATLLPWFFHVLGAFKYNIFFSVLDKEMASGHPPRSQLFGTRFDFKPHPALELGASYFIHFNGDRPGIGRLGFSDYFAILTSTVSSPGAKRDSNKEVAVDAALTIPNVSRVLRVADSMKLYVQWGAEDSDFPPDKRAYVLGAAFYDFLAVPRLTLRAEYARLSPKGAPTAWYDHGIWSMKYKGRVFGHHAGTDSDDVFFELSHEISPDFSCRLGFDRERSGLSKKCVEEKNQYFFEAGYDLKQWWSLGVRYAHEVIDNVENVEGATQKNHLIGVEVGFRF
ncbi:MAG: hypothetical protein JSV55_00215 [Deltaproteobacteria bacterium]|nr:MAG: hypothetical protein JSV55_00215 [Deltaproteobacteria bacterium]